MIIKSIQEIAHAIDLINGKGKRLTDLVMSLETYCSAIRPYGSLFDEEFVTVNLEMGRMGMMWGANIWRDNSLPLNDIRLYNDDELLKKDFPYIHHNKIMLNFMSIGKRQWEYARR